MQALASLGLTLPAQLLLLLVIVLPLLVLLGISLSDYELGAVSSRFVGGDNFRHALNDPTIRKSIGNTSLYVAIVVPCASTLGLVCALMVFGRRRSRSVYEVIYYLPVTSTVVAMATVWLFLLHPTIGPISHMLRAVGIQRTNFLSDPGLVLPTLAAIGVWQLLGFNLVLFLAGLGAVPRELYEAAEIDGCRSALDRFLLVTWPLLAPTTLFVVVTSSITAFKVFETVAVMTRGGPMNASQVLLYSIYVEAFEYLRTGYAAALTLIFLAIIGVLALLQTFLLDRRIHYG
ncbi:MAG TPA: sugar ABC transporter permease [Rhodopila sp.]|nr:sugar ABC transporter permease [Rhodopila sp.]